MNPLEKEIIEASKCFAAESGVHFDELTESMILNAIREYDSRTKQRGSENIDFSKDLKLIERFADNGEHSHWEFIDVKTGETLWSQNESDESKPLPIFYIKPLEAKKMNNEEFLNWFNYQLQYRGISICPHNNIGYHDYDDKCECMDCGAIFQKQRLKV